MKTELRNISKITDDEIFNNYSGKNRWSAYFHYGYYKIFEYNDNDVDVLLDSMGYTDSDISIDNYYNELNTLISYMLMSDVNRYQPHDHDCHKSNMAIVFSSEYFNNKQLGNFLGEYYGNRFVVLNEYYNEFKPKEILYKDLVKLLCDCCVSRFPIGKLDKDIYHICYDGDR